MVLKRVVFGSLAAFLFACSDDNASSSASTDAAVGHDGQTGLLDGSASDAQVLPSDDPGDGGTAPDSQVTMGMDANVSDGSQAQPDGGGSFSCGTVHPTGDVLLDLGPQAQNVMVSGDRLLSTGKFDPSSNPNQTTRVWGLWDAQSFAMIARNESSGPGCEPGPVDGPYAALRGNLLVTVERCESLGDGNVYTPGQLALRDASDGHVLATVNSLAPLHSGNWGIASDGSYLWTFAPIVPTMANTQPHLIVASPAGVTLATHDFTSAVGISIFAAPNELRVAKGPAGPDVIEHISTSTGASTSSPKFAGTFAGWFSDGARFFTQDGAVYRVYSSDAVQQKLGSVGQDDKVLGGVGDYVYVQASDLTQNSRSINPRIDVYKVDGGNAPVATFPRDEYESAQLSVSGTHLLASANGRLVDVDLGVATPTVATTDLPGINTRSAGFAVTAQGAMLSAGDSLWVRTAQATAARPLTCGAALALDLSDDGSWAVGVQVGLILTGKLATRPSVSAFATAATDLTSIELANDGQHVIMKTGGRGLPQNGTQSLYALPSGTLVRTAMAAGTHDLRWGFTQGGAATYSLDCDGVAPCSYALQDLAGTSTAASWTVMTKAPLQLAVSPSGKRVAVGDGMSSYIYDSGTLAGATAFLPLVWLDENRLFEEIPYRSGGGGFLSAKSGAIVDVAGTVQAMPSIPDLDSLAPDFLFPRVDVLANGSLLYVRGGSSGGIYNATTGMQVWTSTTMRSVGDVPGAANDANELRAHGDQVLLIAHP